MQEAIIPVQIITNQIRVQTTGIRAEQEQTTVPMSDLNRIIVQITAAEIPALEVLHR